MDYNKQINSMIYPKDDKATKTEEDQEYQLMKPITDLSYEDIFTVTLSQTSADIKNIIRFIKFRSAQIKHVVTMTKTLQKACNIFKKNTFDIKELKESILALIHINLAINPELEDDLHVDFKYVNRYLKLIIIWNQFPEYNHNMFKETKIRQTVYFLSRQFLVLDTPLPISNVEIYKCLLDLRFQFKHKSNESVLVFFAKYLLFVKTINLNIIDGIKVLCSDLLYNFKENFQFLSARQSQIKEQLEQKNVNQDIIAQYDHLFQMEFSKLKKETYKILSFFVSRTKTDLYLKTQHEELKSFLTKIGETTK